MHFLSFAFVCCTIIFTAVNVLPKVTSSIRLAFRVVTGQQECSLKGNLRKC